ncbi:unnamed protein product [Dicrocoelium dendriticum]|nr:unnamed protein product [Dicrocoelium dendriticum]
MRPARVRWIVCLQVLIIGLYTDLRTIWCIYPDEQFSVPRRLEETVWPERLPLWMEQKRIYSGYHPYVKNDQLSQPYQDIELTSDKTDHEQKQLARLRRAMSVDDVPYERFRGEGGFTDMQVGMTNPAKRAELGLAPGYRRNSAWFPIAIGVTCFLLVALAVFGTVMYYYRVYVPGTNKMDAFNKFGSQNGGSEGVAEWTVLRPAGSRTDGDRKLAHSAQMYHYQHQKQQMLAVERANGQLRGSEDGSESDTEEADFTVYECPALAEVSNISECTAIIYL